MNLYCVRKKISVLLYEKENMYRLNLCLLEEQSHDQVYTHGEVELVFEKSNHMTEYIQYLLMGRLNLCLLEEHSHDRIYTIFTCG